jgi:uncharacterized protein YegL
MAKPTTNVLFVLDMSGSMHGIREETIGMINAQIETLQEKRKEMGKVRVSLIVFGYRAVPGVRVVWENVKIQDVAQFTSDDYLPQGMTPMRDGIGSALTLGETLDSGDAEDAVLVITITDGAENSSHEWTAQALADKVKELRDTGRWTFQILGANIDFSNVKDFGVEKSEFSAYAANAVGMEKTSIGLGGSLGAYSAARSRGVTATQGLDVPDSVPKDIKPNSADIDAPEDQC